MMEEKKEKKQFINKLKKSKYVPAIICSLITLIICLGGFYLFYNYNLKDLVIEKTKIEKDVTITDKGIADAVDKVYNSVVIIETYQNDRLYSTGTGFVFKTDDNYGYILTNYHVIDSSNKIKVTFTNEQKIDVEVVGTDQYSDIAVLKVKKESVIETAQIGSSKDLKIGDTTFTVGAPIDSKTYSWTVTRGILSGKDRLVEVSINNYNSYVMEVLQTDAAINSGNSGGPLCNSNGEVIGITNMKLASSTIEGMGFAIPIEEAIENANTLISGESISRPYLGISIYDSKNVFYGTSNGLFIESVETNSPADKAGLKKGDQIIKINDVTITNSSYFKYNLYKYNIGDTINITYSRDSKENVAKVTLGSYNQNA